MTCGTFRCTIVFPFLSFFLPWVFPRYFNVISILILLYSENIFCVNSVILILYCNLFFGSIYHVLVNVSCVLEKNVRSAVVGWCVL